MSRFLMGLAGILIPILLNGQVLKITDADRELPVTSFEPLLSGKISGVQIFNTSGQVGACYNILIRGVNNVWRNPPIYILDGVEVLSGEASQIEGISSGILNTLNPEDIESITILKDATAVPIYGYRGINGVIIIETKQGKGKRLNVKFNASVGVSPGFASKNSVRASDLDQRTLFRENFYNTYKMMGANDMQAAERAQVDLDKYLPRDPRGFFDWEDAIYKNGVYQNYNLEVSGQIKDTRYYVSGAYTGNSGMVASNDFGRWSGRINFSQKFLKIVEWKSAIFYSSVKQNSFRDNSCSNENLFFAERNLLFNDWWPESADGELVIDDFNTYARNPLYYNDLGEITSRVKRVSVNESLTATLWKDFKISTMLVYENYKLNGFEWWSPEHWKGSPNNGSIDDISARTNSLSSYSYAGWDKKIASDHHIRVNTGFEFAQNERMEKYMQGFDMFDNMTKKISECKKIVEGTATYHNSYCRAYLVNGGYSYKNKYFISGGFRYENETNLARLEGEPNGMTLKSAADTWSVSGEWNIKNENWLKNRVWLSALSLNVSYGQGVKKYSSESIMPQMPPKYNMLNAALYAGFFNNRLDFSAEYFIRNTFMPYVEIPNVTTGNFPDIRIKGFEFSVSGNIINTSLWKWNMGMNASIATNRVINTHGTDNQTYIFYSGFAKYLVREGESPLSFYGEEYAGVDPDNGVAMWFLNKENYDEKEVYKVIDGRAVTNDVRGAESIIIGCAEPKLYGGINTDVSWNGFSLSLNFIYSLGGDAYNERGYRMNDDGYLGKVASKKSLDRWVKKGDIAAMPQRNIIIDNLQGSNRWLYKNNYLRLKSLNLSYTLPKSLINKLKLSNVRLYFTGFNLLTFAGNNDFDPEVNMYGCATWRMPLSRTYSFGIEIGI